MVDNRPFYFLNSNVFCIGIDFIMLIMHLFACFIGISLLQASLSLVRSTSKLSTGIINFVISEGASIGDVIGTLESADVFNFSRSSSMSSSSSNSDETDKRPWFVLQDTTYFELKGAGQKTVVVNKLLDRDNDRKLCTESSWPETCAWSGVLFARDGVVLSLRITILDINDNIPRWPDSALSKPNSHKEPEIELYVAENTPIGSMFDLPLAEDKDYGTNGIVNYELLITDDDRFSLNCVSGPNGVIPRLQILTNLDRESKVEHTLQISAIDGGSQRVSVGLQIYVVDENDNPPVFTHLVNLSREEAQRKRFVIEVDESMPLGSALPMNPIARDADTGEFGHIRYRFSFSTPHFIRRDFSIDAESGKIIVQNTLDCDIGGISEYSFSLIAEDSASQPLTSVATVVILVHDVNDHSPLISLTPAIPKVDESYGNVYDSSLEIIQDSFSLVEETPSGQLVATVTVTDPDADLNGEFNCDLTNNRDFSLNSLPLLGSTKIYQLLSTRSFDRETEPVTSVALNCTDNGNPSQSSIKVIPITLIDINDNRPYFEQMHYQFSIQENKEPDSVIGKVVVKDDDVGINAAIQYTLIWPNTPLIRSIIQINSNGELIAKETLDREMMPSGFKFTVVAEDQGTPSYRASAEVSVIIEDMNDCHPKFSQTQYQFEVDESGLDNEDESYRRHPSQRKLIGSVHATDCDLGQNALIHYYFAQMDIPFEVSTNGSIYAVGRLDRETVPSYLLTMVAKDSAGVGAGNDGLKSSTKVLIKISDVNDNAPVFIFPKANLSSSSLSAPEFKISALEPVGHFITRVQATDADIGVNAEIRYSISAGNWGKFFHIIETNGELRIYSPLPSLSKIKLKMAVHARDNGTPSRISTLDLIIHIDPSLKPTSTSLFDRLDNNKSDADRLANIYLIVFITFGVTVSFIILTLAICCMAKSGSGGGGSECIHCYSLWKSASSFSTSSSSSGTSNQKANLKAVGGSGGGVESNRDFYSHQTNLSQMPDRCATMTFSNGDYTIGSNSFTLEKKSPVHFSYQDDTITSQMRHLTMNSFIDPTFGNPVYGSIMRDDSSNLLERSGYDVSNLDQFNSSLQRPTYPETLLNTDPNSNPIHQQPVANGGFQSFLSHSDRHQHHRSNGMELPNIVVYSWSDSASRHQCSLGSEWTG